MVNIEENIRWLLDYLKSCTISKKEIEYRKQQLEHAATMPKSEIGIVSDRYHNLAHEIKSFHFLCQFGNMAISEDYRSDAGCDCKLNDNYQIECVCSSAGKKAEERGLCVNNSTGFYVGTYSESFFLRRFATSLDKKLLFYSKHIDKATINPNAPYLIFLGLGALANYYFPYENGIDFTGVLFGKGDPRLSIDIETGYMTPNGYTHNPFLINHNNSEIECNIFLLEKYQCISGIIVSTGKLDEEYDFDNTWLFLTPTHM